MIRKYKKIKIASLALAVMTLFAVFFPTTPSRTAKAENLTSLSFQFYDLEYNGAIRYELRPLQYKNITVFLYLNPSGFSLDVNPMLFYSSTVVHNGVASERLRTVDFSTSTNSVLAYSQNIGTYGGGTGSDYMFNLYYLLDYSFKEFDLSTLAFTMYRVEYADYAGSVMAEKYPYITSSNSTFVVNTVTYSFYFSDSVLDNYIKLTFPFLNLNESKSSSYVGMTKKSTPLRYVQSLTSVDMKSAFDSGYAAGKKDYNGSGYQRGYDDGVISAENNTFLTLLDAVFYAPVKAVVSLFDFDLLGFNMLSFVKAIFTLIVLLSIVHLIL